MAQRVEVVLVDDVDGGEALETVGFSLDGSTYEIDLSGENARGLRDTFAPWLANARKVRAGRSVPAPVDLGPSPQVLRAWARANGHAVPSRGRVPADIRAAYEEANV